MRLPSVDLIDYQDSRPIYEQISEKFKILILKGILEPDEKMPSVRQLAMDLSTNPNTVQRAYSELERQGFLYSVKGKGNFVSPNPNLRDMKKQELLERLRALLKESEDSGIPREELLSALSGKKVRWS
jgi:GntR family transcriptional regulator